MNVENYQEEDLLEEKIVFTSQVEKAQIELLQLLISDDIDLRRNVLEQLNLDYSQLLY